MSIVILNQPQPQRISSKFNLNLNKLNLNPYITADAECDALVGQQRLAPVLQRVLESTEAAPVVLVVLRALANVLANPTGEPPELRSGLLTVLRRAVEAHSDDGTIVTAAYQVLGNAVAADTGALVAEPEPILELLKHVMEAMPGHAGAMKAACNALANLAAAGGTGIAVIKHGFLALLKRVMEHQSGDPEVLQAACEALDSIQL